MQNKLVAQIEKLVLKREPDKIILDLLALTKASSVTFANIFTLSEQTLTTAIKDTSLSLRNKNSLLKMDITTVKKLSQTDISLLFRFRGIGIKAFKEIVDYFATNNMTGKLEIQFAKAQEILSAKQHIIKNSTQETTVIDYIKIFRNDEICIADLITISSKHLETPTTRLGLTKGQNELIIDNLKLDTLGKLINYSLPHLSRPRGIGKKGLENLLNKLRPYSAASATFKIP